MRKRHRTQTAATQFIFCHEFSVVQIASTVSHFSYDPLINVKLLKKEIGDYQRKAHLYLQ